MHPRQRAGGIVAEERLQKLLARAGYGSRRACEAIIEQRRVTVNGAVATLGSRADPARDDVRVDGQPLRLPESFDYIMLNKPRDVISDEDVVGNWPAARDMIPLEGQLYPVGRLDVKSEGLMLFTNDGELAHRLTHPSFEHPKTYHVLVGGHPDDQTLETWRAGVELEGQRTLPAEVRRLRRMRDQTLLEVTMREGRKRQIRRVASALRAHVLRLQRVKLGPLELGDLPTGAWRRLTEEEVQMLRAVREGRKPRRGQPGRSRRPATPRPSQPGEAASGERPSGRRPGQRPTGRPARRPTGKPGRKPGGKPAQRPAGQPARKRQPRRGERRR